MTEPQADGIRATCAPLRVHALFILDENRNPIPCPNIDQWAAWFQEERNSQLGRARVGGVTIITRFIGVRLPAPPESGLENLFFETTIRRGFFGGDSLRTQTYNGAMRAHALAVALVTRFRFIPLFIQDPLRFAHEATTYFRFRMACLARAILS